MKMMLPPLATLSKVAGGNYFDSKKLPVPIVKNAKLHFF